MIYKFTLADDFFTDDTAISLTLTNQLYFRLGMALSFGAVSVTIGEAFLPTTNPFILQVAPLTADLLKGAVGSIELIDTDRVARFLGIPIAYWPKLQTYLARSITDVPGIELELSRLLAEIDSIEAFAVSQALNTNSGLIKAGSLAWSPGAQIGTYNKRLGELRAMLMNLLGCADLVPGGGMGGAGGSGFTGVTKTVKGYC
jgi:hypothetical protein